MSSIWFHCFRSYNIILKLNEWITIVSFLLLFFCYAAAAFIFYLLQRGRRRREGREKRKNTECTRYPGTPRTSYLVPRVLPHTLCRLKALPQAGVPRTTYVNICSMYNVPTIIELYLHLFCTHGGSISIAHTTWQNNNNSIIIFYDPHFFSQEHTHASSISIAHMYDLTK